MSYSFRKKDAYRSSVAAVQVPSLETVTRYRKQYVSRYKKAPSKVQIYVQWAILLAVVFGVLQCVRALLVESYKLSVLSQYQPVVQKYYYQSVQENQQLQEKIKMATSPQGIEAMARNNLNLVGQDEILVRFHQG